MKGWTRGKTKSLLSLLIAIVMTASIVLGGSITVFANGTNDNGVPPEKLTIKLIGMNNVEKEVSVTRSEFDALAEECGGYDDRLYSYIDNLPTPVIASAHGVYLSKLISGVGARLGVSVDVFSQVNTIKLSATDGANRTMTPDDLRGFSYPDLGKFPFYFEDDNFVTTNEAGVRAHEDKIEVMIAVSSEWRRIMDQNGGTGFDDYANNEDYEVYFRLMTVADQSLPEYATHRTASSSLKWVENIDVYLNFNLPVASAGGSSSSSDDDTPNNQNQSQTTSSAVTSGSAVTGSAVTSGSAVTGGAVTSGSAVTGGAVTSGSAVSNETTTFTAIKISDISAVKGTLTDIAGNWAEDEIYKMVALGSINGNPDGTFAPGKTVSRAEFLTMLMKSLEKFGQAPVVSGSSQFEDIKGHWAEKYITQAFNAGIVKGTSETTFSPDNTINRQEMAVMICNALQLKSNGKVVNDADNPAVASWAVTASNVCSTYGIMPYDGNNKFYPLDELNRAQTAVVLWRAFLAKGYVTE